MRLFLLFLIAFFASACTISHFNKSPDGEYDASNYSLFMDRENVAIKTPTSSIGIGSSKTSKDSLREIKEGLLGLADKIK